jgi:hypothetical protein
MLQGILALYVSGIVGIAVTGIIVWAIVGVGMGGRLSHRSQTDLCESFPWWSILLVALMGGSGALLYSLFKDAWPPDKRLEALAGIAAGQTVGIVVLALSGYFMLSPLNLRGLGQKLGVVMGIVFAGQIRELLMSHLGGCVR